tara:strand:- start:580 stop:1368 length:789 start_codon:yes stop_codon:yes gene_type:complete
MNTNFIDFKAANISKNEDVILPERTGDIKKVLIREKLKLLGVDLEDISLGDFDQIGEHTARKNRSPDSELYKKSGAFFRPNYERGILIYSLITKYNLKSFLEIGFGRGYSTMCAAYAFSKIGGGTITTVDPNLDRTFIENLAKIFPRDWFENISFIKAKSEEYVPQDESSYDLVYIDGDHTYDAVKKDWEMCKDKYKKFLLFDDYHMPDKVQKDIDCSNLIDQIEDPSKELIIMDRRIFFDDRRIQDIDINYGQVLLTRSDF